IAAAVSKPDQASSSGGTMVLGRRVKVPATAALTCAAVAVGTSDQASATAPVTNGAAALVPPSVSRPFRAPVLLTLSPGALKPRGPMEPPRFDWPKVRPPKSQATTGITQGCRVTAVPPTVP